MVIFPAAFLNIALECTQKSVRLAGTGRGGPLSTIWAISALYGVPISLMLFQSAWRHEEALLIQHTH